MVFTTFILELQHKTKETTYRLSYIGGKWEIAYIGLFFKPLSLIIFHKFKRFKK